MFEQRRLKEQDKSSCMAMRIKLRAPGLTWNLFIYFTYLEYLCMPLFAAVPMGIPENLLAPFDVDND